MKDSCSVIKEQVSRTKPDDMYVKPRESTVYSHPSNSHVGMHAVPVLAKLIERSNDAKVSWKCKNIDSIQSFVACLQMFSDKSQTSSRGMSLSFYALHVTLVYFSEEQGRSHIVSVRTNFAYIHVQVQQTENTINSTRTEVSNELVQKKSRTSILEALHENIEICLQNLARAAVPGLTRRSADRSDILFHLLRTSCVADTPECEGMLSLKCGTQTSYLCHIRFFKKDDFTMITAGRRRNLGAL